MHSAYHFPQKKLAPIPSHRSWVAAGQAAGASGQVTERGNCHGYSLSWTKQWSSVLAQWIIKLRNIML